MTTRPLSSIHWWTSSNSSFVNLIDVKSSNGRDRPTPSSTENLFRAVAVPAWPPPFNWLTTSSYPLSRCQIGSHQTGGGLLPSGGCHQGSTCTEAIGRTIRKSATAPALRGILSRCSNLLITCLASIKGDPSRDSLLKRRPSLVAMCSLEQFVPHPGEPPQDFNNGSQAGCGKAGHNH